MFDDSRLRKLNTAFPQQIFQKLPTLRPHSKPLVRKVSQNKEFFNEFTPLNQINFRQPPLFPLPMTQRNNNNRGKDETNKVRSVSFIDFSDALTTVARISKLEEQYANCNNGNILRKLMQTSRVPRNAEKREDNYYKNKRVLAAESLSLNKKAPVNIFNYPDLGKSNRMAFQPQQKKKLTFLADDYYEKPSMLIRGNHNNNYEVSLKKHELLREKNSLEKKEVLQNFKKNNANDQEYNLRGKKDIVKVRVKTSSFHKENKKDGNKLFSRVRDKISNKKLVTLGEENEIIKKCNKKPKDSPKILFEDAKVAIEPWKIQDSFSEEMC